MKSDIAPSSMMLPSLAIGDLSWPGRGAWGHLAGDRPVTRLRSGRLGIAAALRNLGVAAGDEVLVPAYHCPSMVEPVAALGAEPRFYRIGRDLQPDVDDIGRRLSGKSKAILAAHFYGVLADLAGLRRICDDAGLALIEDCAHCFSYCSDAGAFGTFGDYVVTSPRKFVPTFDGGELIAGRGGETGGHGSPLDLRYQLKVLKNTLESAWIDRRVRPRLLQDMLAAAERFQPPAETSDPDTWRRPEEGSGETYADPRFSFTDIAARDSVSGRLLARLLSIGDIVWRRQRNYRMLRDLCEGLDGAWLLEEQAARFETPYVMPLYVEAGDAAYAHLLEIGVPMWRWDELHDADCEVSREYGRRVIQFPCHQGLSPADMESIGRAITAVLGRLAR